MCGRFTLFSSPQELQEEFEMPIPDFEPSYNIAPTEQVLAIATNKEEAKAGFLHWGLIPSWFKDKKGVSKMVNARAETINEKPAFKNLLTHRRCLIPANGFYEWKRDGAHKYPYFIKRSHDQIITFAGLWDVWRDHLTGSEVASCTIITTTPNNLMSNLHDRMPVILDEGNRQAWLDSQIKDPTAIKSMLLPYPRKDMEAYEVSTEVNNTRTNGPFLVKSIE